MGLNAEWLSCSPKLPFGEGLGTGWTSPSLTLSQTRRPGLRNLEIRLLRFGCGVDLQIEVIRIVLGAGPFFYRHKVATRIALAHVPWGGEGPRIFDMDPYLQGLAALDNLKAFDDMKLLSVGRSVIVD